MIDVPLTPDIRTTPLGFGCADLFRLPGAPARRAMLEAAFAEGIRHFDVAPMYGLGVAEPELGAFARHRRDEVVIVTKFGIRPTPLSRAVGRIQGPIRALLSAAPGAREAARSAAPGPGSGTVGSLLYRSDGYGADAARRSLERSLRALGTDYIDLLLLHDPAPEAVDPEDTRRFLDDAQRRGLIRAWGVAGEARASVEVAERLLGSQQVIQVRDDLVQRQGRLASVAPPALPRITFGILGRTMNLVRRHLEQHPEERAAWNDEVGVDCGRADDLGAVLFAEAFESNPHGVTLFTTTRPERIRKVVNERERFNGDPSQAAAVLRRRVEALVGEQGSVGNGR